MKKIGLLKLLSIYFFIKTTIIIKFYQLFYNINLNGRQIFYNGFKIYSNSNKIFIKFGNVRARENFKIQLEDSAKLSIGDGVFFNNNCSINVLEEVNTGNNVIFGENVKLYDHNHRFNLSNMLIKEQGFTTKEINIGENSWIGSNVVILKGVNIGSNVVIGANCLIYKDIADNSLVINRNMQEISIISK